jgi:hypothetical protein
MEEEIVVALLEANVTMPSREEILRRLRADLSERMGLNLPDRPVSAPEPEPEPRLAATARFEAPAAAETAAAPAPEPQPALAPAAAPPEEESTYEPDEPARWESGGRHAHAAPGGDASHPDDESGKKKKKRGRR